MGRAAYHHGNLRKALVDAGLAILKEKGIDGLTLRMVAQRAGVSASAPYRHFQDATHLLAAIAQQGFLELRRSMEVALQAPGLGDLSRLERVGMGYVRFGRRFPDHLRLMFSSKIPAEMRPQELTDAGLAAYRILEESVSASMAQSELAYESGAAAALEACRVLEKPVDPRLVAMTAWTFIHGFTMLLIDGHLLPMELPPDAEEELVRGCQDILRRGWGDRLMLKKTPQGRKRK